MSNQRWFAFECFKHYEDTKTGVVFDVRVDDEPHLNDAMKTAKCPRCGEECELRGTWQSDEDGYGSGGHPQRLAERRHSELLKALASIADKIRK